jgi:two-component system sensor histidine kinase UhpB
MTDLSLERLEEIVDFQEHERQLLVAELHDGLAQELVALSLKLHLVGPGAEDALGQSRRLTAQLTALMTDLRSPVAEGEDLLTAVERLVEGWDGRLRVAYVPPASSHVVTGLVAHFAYRLVQEALRNVFRHAGCLEATLELSIGKGEVRGRIRDFGKGFVPETLETRRFGLKGMRLRAELAGGSLRVASAPGEGTTVEFGLPMEPEDGRRS